MLSTALAGLIGLAAFATPAAAFEENIKQGGSMVVTYKDDVATLDPAIGYDWQNWSMIKSLFTRLMDYEPGTSKLTKDLADDYTVSPDGLVYTFKLHHGVKFTNGRELTADDVKYSLDRATNPKTQSPGASFFKSIKGYDDIAGGKADTLAGVSVVDPYTVKIELAHADATILQVLALNFASVVPKEEVEKAGADFGKHPVGSGAFKLSEWTLGQRIVFERNKDYFKAGVPKLDQVTFEVGQEPVVALLRMQRGEVDLPGDGIPPAKYMEVTKDPAYQGRILRTADLKTSYITMNTRMKPFDDVRVRKAVNMAINKDRIVRVINGRATPANQVLPPDMPGYDKDYKGYSYDPAKAKDLLKEAGLADGFETTIFTNNTDPNPRITQAIQQDLAAVGIKATIKALDQANVIAAGGEPDQAPMIWSGGMAWGADFPDPSDFYGPILSCASATKGGWNWSWYCNKDLDQQGLDADAMADPAKAEERYAKWKGIFDKVMDDAPWVPVFNDARISVHSPKIGGSDAQFLDLVHQPVNYDYIYATDVQ
ncbi:ABC transporter substrate-binding protein [Faunimonas pinastri]|uniref:ABC transporter substrate-binding protein n=1 Tax=Faunimonas pinastri TaxID=1855383 RepID=UPI003D17237A